MTDKPLSITLSRPEVDLLHDAIAGWLARYLMHAERMDGEPADGFDFQIMTTLGNKDRDEPVSADEPLSDSEVRVCPLGPPHEVRRPGSRERVAYAWCSECQRVRKSTAHCPMIEAQQ